MADEVLGYMATHTFASGGQEQTVETPSLPFATFLDRIVLDCERAWNRCTPDHVDPAVEPDETGARERSVGPRPSLTLERPHYKAPDSIAKVTTIQREGEPLANWKRRFLGDVQRNFAAYPPA